MSHQVDQSVKILQWIMDSLKSQGFASKETQSTSQLPNSSSFIYANLHICCHNFVCCVFVCFVWLISCHFFLFHAASTTTDSESPETEKDKDGFHVNARQLYYPNSKLKRFPVPEEMVPWEVFSIHFHHEITSCWSLLHAKNTGSSLF